MKKAVAIAAAVVLIAAAVLSVPLVNDLCAAANRDRLLSIDLPTDTVRIETVCEAGKLVGNGNGMQFFAALLIQSDRTLAELQTYYAPHDCFVEQQTEQTITVVDRELSFETSFSEQDTYYIVYSWGGEGIAPFSWLDIRGA